MWNFILLFVCAISGNCATPLTSGACAMPNDIFAQVDAINGKQLWAYLVAEKGGDDDTTLYITPHTRITENLGLHSGLAISMEDIKTKSAKIEIERGRKPLTTIRISRFPREDGNENCMLQVFTNGARLVSASYLTNQKNAQNIKEPQLSMPPASGLHGRSRAEISFDLPKSIDSHAYTLAISTILEKLPQFRVTCKTTAQERDLFDIVYPQNAVEPTILEEPNSLTATPITSGACAMPNGIFAQAEAINRQQKSAYLVATKDDGNTTLYINPQTQTDIMGLATGLAISMDDIKKNADPQITIHRGGERLATITISRYPRGGGAENFLLGVRSKNDVLQVSANYRTNQKNVQNIKEPQLSAHPIQHGMSCAEISFDLPESIDSHTYTLVISAILEKLPQFKVTCKTTAQECFFDLVYPKYAVEPTILSPEDALAPTLLGLSSVR